ncbi:MAG: hypothetical protein ACE14L_09075 [Terriglobales bacterium]
MLRRTGFIAMLIAVVAVAHAAPDPQAAASPATPTQARATTKAAVSQRAASPAAPGKARPTAAKTKAQKAAPAAVTATPIGKPAPEMEAKQAGPAKPRRDPFLSIIQERIQTASTCTTGKKCLAPDQIVLKGVVKGPQGMIALVEGQHRKAYFLRENDPVLNGEVVRINSDSIVFRERVTDRIGRVSVREVVKRMPGAKPV